ncbi:MAG: dockerin type I repeat-containing protein, partial [Clostridia bacterium]|nr:dockerin type I repeat-containing protein [Clostridia bacterium]
NSHANDTTSYISCRVPMFMGDKLTFEYYYDTEQNYDWFDFFVNGNSYMHVSGSGGWHEYSFTAYTEGIFTFTWQYEKDVSNHVGNDCIMIDNVRRIIDQEQTYGVDDSLNISGGSLHFTTSSSPTFWGDYWYDDSIVTASNYGSPSTTATIQTSITMYEGDALDFEYYVSSEENYDWFTFTVNGQTEMRLSGNLGWNRYYYTAPETGYYTFVWSYSKDNSVNKYMDTVKLDNIQHYKFTPSLDTALNSDATDVWMHFTSTGTYPFRVNRENVYGLYAESSNQGVNSSTSSMTSSVSLSAGDELSFYYTVNSETNYDWFEFYVNGTRTIRQSGEIGAQYYTYSVPTSGVYTFEWRYTKDSSQSVGSDTVTVTEVRIRGTGILWGDADNNGLVNANDALMVLRYSLNLITTMPNMAAADYDRNGTINTNDALMILRKAMNLI